MKILAQEESQWQCLYSNLSGTDKSILWISSLPPRLKNKFNLWDPHGGRRELTSHFRHFQNPEVFCCNWVALLLVATPGLALGMLSPSQHEVQEAEPSS